MSSDEKESIFKKVLITALVTATGVIVSAYTTNMVKQMEFDDEKNKQARQITEASKVTNERLNEYVQKYDNLLKKYEKLLYEMSSQSSSKNILKDIVKKPQTISIGGQWFTPDGTVTWNFSENRVTVSGFGAFSGIINGTGTYNMTKGTLTGEVYLTTFLWLPTNETVRFSASVNIEGNMITGSLEDMLGQITPLTLYK